MGGRCHKKQYGQIYADRSQVGSALEKIVVYDSSTKWVSQEHGSKTVNDIDASQVKDDDRVICKGTYDKDGVLHATLISKRLSRP